MDKDKSVRGQANKKEGGQGEGSLLPKVVVVIIYEDGRTVVNQIEPEEAVEDDLGSGSGRLVSHLDLKETPKRYQVLIEKWGKGSSK